MKAICYGIINKNKNISKFSVNGLLDYLYLSVSIYFLNFISILMAAIDFFFF
jgi:hypothetical protein